VSVVTRCGCDVHGMVLLQAHLHYYSLLRGFTVEVLPLSSYALSSTMLPLLETFLELVLCNSFRCLCRVSFMSSVS
jgi:hypothetical protein